MGRLGGAEVEIDDDVVRVMFFDPNPVAGHSGLDADVREAVEGGLPRAEVSDVTLKVQSGVHASMVSPDASADHPSFLGNLGRPVGIYAGRVTRDTFLAGVSRTVAHTDDDRVLRRAVLEHLRRSVPFDAFAWLLTDPDTTVGTAPLAEVPCMDRLPDLVALLYTSAERWSANAPGTPYRPVAPGSQLAHFLSVYGEYDVLSIAFADRFGWWAFLDLWREGGRFSSEESELVALLAAPVTAALRASRAAMFVHQDADAPRATEPAVLVLGPDLIVQQQTPGAEAQLRALLPTEESRPLVRTAVAPGKWISVQAARLGENIAVTVSPLEQREHCALFCRTHAMSGCETELLNCLAEGDDTHTLAARLHLSEHTVQDHLKSAFAKAGVRSRRELLTLARGN